MRPAAFATRWRAPRRSRCPTPSCRSSSAGRCGITEHQIEYKRLWYNEIIIDAKHWRSHLPDQVEAIFNNPENHRRFLAAFPHLTPESHPHVLLDATNWHSPFSMDHPDGDG